MGEFRSLGGVRRRRALLGDLVGARLAVFARCVLFVMRRRGTEVSVGLFMATSRDYRLFLFIRKRKRKASALSRFSTLASSPSRMF